MKLLSTFFRLPRYKITEIYFGATNKIFKNEVFKNNILFKLRNIILSGI